MQDVEKELEVQIGMKQEMELSMKMLEKDICEKQDALVELRQQLEDLRVINQQLSHKSQVRLHLGSLGPYFNDLSTRREAHTFASLTVEKRVRASGAWFKSVVLSVFINS